jgi:hypothetical protein
MQLSAPQKRLMERVINVRPIWLPTVENLCNFFLTTPTEMLSFFQEVREAA